MLSLDISSTSTGQGDQAIPGSAVLPAHTLLSTLMLDAKVIGAEWLSFALISHFPGFHLLIHLVVRAVAGASALC